MATPALPNPSPLLDDPLPPEPKPRRETKVWKPKMRDPDTREPPAAVAAQDPEAHDNEEAEEPEPEQDEGPEPPPLLPTDAIEPTPSSAEEDGDDDSSSVSSASSAATPDASVAAAGGKTERPFPAATDLLHISYNQDYGCFAVGTKTGFRIYNCDPFREIFRRDLGPSPAAAATPADQDAGPLTAK